ncbi:MAG: cytochrome c [Opitutaceae bacterium]|nr:cytochrome c [Opitutaceae bacterium]
MPSASKLLCLLLPVAVLTMAAAELSPDKNWEKHCHSCHGKDGRSQTRLGKKSGAKDLTDAAQQAKLTDEAVFKTIKEGRKNAKGEEKMEAFAGQMSDAEITALVTYVRGLAKK